MPAMRSAVTARGGVGGGSSMSSAPSHFVSEAAAQAFNVARVKFNVAVASADAPPGFSASTDITTSTSSASSPFVSDTSGGFHPSHAHSRGGNDAARS